MSEYQINLNVVLEKEAQLLNFVKNNSTEGLYLNLGCGHKTLPGFVNVDKYVKKDNIINYDIFKLPYQDNQVDGIYSSHVLEHLPIRHAKLALSEWFRVLKPNGTLWLLIPDLEIIMLKLLDYTQDDHIYDWYLCTLFGWQIDSGIRSPALDIPVDEGQIHKSGFTKKTIQKELSKLGFKIEELFNYNGYDTPSIWVKAVK